MEIRKINSYLRLSLDNVNFTIDSLEKTADNIILTDNYKESNSLMRDKIFAGPGEYNVGSVYFWGFKNKANVVYLFDCQEGSMILCRDELTEETFKSIKTIKKEVDSLLGIEKIDEQVVKNFKPTIIITTYEPEQIRVDYSKQVGSSFKVNIKKTKESILILK
ncbi:MAG: hypothetical protein NZ822_02135 [Patescibacteria group bacterium]|nr:hypothetical protein [Patescibacteria group bacterium]